MKDTHKLQHCKFSQKSNIRHFRPHKKCWNILEGLLKALHCDINSRFSPFLCGQFLAGNSSTKRKSMTSPEGKSRKKVKSGDAPGEDSGNEKGEQKKKKKDSQGLPLSPTIWGHMQVS